MAMNVKKQGLTNIVLLAVIVVAFNIGKAVPALSDSSWYLPISLLTATGTYVTLMSFLMVIIPRIDFLMRIYWGKLYLSGYWSYEYTKEGKLYVGIWQIEQDLDEIRIIGSGLNDDFKQRTIVKSVSPLIEDSGSYFVINQRQELENTIGHIVSVYSKTNLVLDIPHQGFRLTPVVTIRATTEVFGGVSSGDLHPDVIFRKHVKAKSNEDVIEDLKTKYVSPSEPSTPYLVD